jgi:hypothetical protein
VVAGGVLLADGGGEHVGGAVVDDLFHGGAADFVEGARPEHEFGGVGWVGWAQTFGEGFAQLARAGSPAGCRGQLFPLSLR